MSNHQSRASRNDTTAARPVDPVTRSDRQSDFDDYLLGLTAELVGISAADVEANIVDWLDPLALLLGAELGAVAEYNSAAGRIRYGLQWLIGQGPSPFEIPHDSWIRRKLAGGDVVSLRTLDELPPEGASDRLKLEELGVRSGLWVPMIAEEVPIGALVLSTLSREVSWQRQWIRRCQIVANLLGGTVNDVRRHEALLRFEDSIAKLSTEFVNLPAEGIDQKIEAGLAMTAKALDADVVTLSRPTADGEIETTHDWITASPDEHPFKGMRYGAEFPWLRKQLGETSTLLITSLSDWPAEAAGERAVCKSLGIESVLGVPFKVRGQHAGHLSVNSYRERHWSVETVPRIRLLGELFGEALIRQRAEMDLEQSFKEIEALKSRLEQENVYLRQEVDLSQSYADIVGSSEALRAALHRVEQVAATDSSVLILGETGTGKDLMAQAIHNLSSRSSKPLVKVNCAALPSSLVEAELFGREKGAFTGALSRELGRFEIADCSTIFLDEISELPMDLQSKLLRVLQDGEFERLGSTKTCKVDVRVIAATNRDLLRAVQGKTFREDLYFRLNVFPIVVPPLRERISDLPELVYAFVEEFSASMNKRVDIIPAAVMKALSAYQWPGNIRELRNIIERAMIVTQGQVLQVELPERFAEPGETGDSRLAVVERNHIRAIVESAGWRISGRGGAAEMLGLKPTTLEARMKKLGIKRPARE